MSNACCAVHPNVSNMAKGCGYFLAATGCSLALLGIAALVATVALGLLAWDGLFLYSIGIRTTLNLIWAIPLTLIFVAIDCLLIAKIIEFANRASRYILTQIEHYGNNMISRFQAVHL